jgi:dipeptidyl-peptidase 4
MNRQNKFFTLLFLLTLSVFGQQKISINEIYSGAFQPNGMDELQSMKNSNQYTVLNFDRASSSMQLNLFNFATLKKVETILDTKLLTNLPLIDSYSFDKAESQILLACNSTPIFRHSFLADYYLYDLKSKKVIRLFDFQIQEPTFSPDGKKIAYARNNNLFVYDLNTKFSTQITTDGKKNEIINGITDWVYEEEFAFVKAFDWSSDSKKIAFIRFDESQVPEFSMTKFKKDLYPKIETIKYPKAGEKNAEVSLHIFTLGGTINKIDLSKYKDFYISNIQWTNNTNTLSALVLNRHQSNVDLLNIDGTTGASKIILNEKDKAYVDVTDKMTILKDDSFIWKSEIDGYNHFYLYDKTGKLINQITKGNWEVTNFYGYDEKTKSIFYQSVEVGSINRAVYKIGIDGKNKTQLSTNLGTNSATFSPNFQFFINSFSSVTKPTTYTLNDATTGKQVQEIVNNQELSKRLLNYNLPTKEFFALKTDKGNELNAWIIKPKDFDATKKYPVLMYQYSGPGSQQVANDWLDTNDYWYMMLSQMGYIVVCVDGRGTGFKGSNFKKCTQKELGKYEVEDQIDAAKVIGNYPYVDKTRIGIWGWSYGGFMSSNCILKGADVFKMAIAVAPVTNWRFYDTVYTERYMQTPQENASGYDENSPINHVDKLKGKYLLIHGSGDDNVHFQNSMQMMEALIQANKQFDSQIYPDKNHGIYGGKTRIQLYDKMTNFIKANL